MQHTDDEVERACLRCEQLADSLDPAATNVSNTDDLSQIAVFSEAVRADEASLREGVTIARAHGRSWNEIALALGITRQAARQRFADLPHV